MPFTSQYLKYH